MNRLSKRDLEDYSQSIKEEESKLLGKTHNFYVNKMKLLKDEQDKDGEGPVKRYGLVGERRVMADLHKQIKVSLKLYVKKEEQKYASEV